MAERARCHYRQVAIRRQVVSEQLEDRGLSVGLFGVKVADQQALDSVEPAGQLEGGQVAVDAVGGLLDVLEEQPLVGRA